MRNVEAVEGVPRIEVIEGVGADYLVWTRDTILRLLARVDELDARVRELEGHLR